MLVTCLLVAVATPAGAQTDPASTDVPTTTTTTSATSATATVPVDPATTVPVPDTITTVPAETTTAPPTTTTTVPAAPWTANVPGPPPPAPVSATPAEIARANQLEQEIVTQADVLDVLASQYDLAQQKVADTAAALAQMQSQLAAATARADAATVDVQTAGQTLRRVAVDVYVNLGAGTPAGPDALIATYERGQSVAAGDTAIGKALSQVQQLHQAEVQLRASEAAIVTNEQKAADASRAATTAAAQVQAAAQAATVQQQQILNTVSQVTSNLAPLVAAAQAAQAQAAFIRFSTSGGLDFQASAALAAPSSQAAAVVSLAMAQVGKPYVWGAAGPDSFDCSGLVQWAWAHQLVATPRVAADQQAWATPVPISQLAPGDLVFFGNPAHHVGIYVGGGLMVDAPHTGANVSVAPIWWDDLAGFGRVH